MLLLLGWLGLDSSRNTLKIAIFTHQVFCRMFSEHCLCWEQWYVECSSWLCLMASLEYQTYRGETGETQILLFSSEHYEFLLRESLNWWMVILNLYYLVLCFVNVLMESLICFHKLFQLVYGLNHSWDSLLWRGKPEHCTTLSAMQSVVWEAAHHL